MIRKSNLFSPARKSLAGFAAPHRVRRTLDKQPGDHQRSPGFLLGTTIGAVLGLALWYSRLVAQISRPYITALSAVPIFALSPIIISWFGIEITSKIMLAFLSTVCMALVQSYMGAMSVEKRYLKLMQVVGAKRSQTFRLVVVPSSLIWVLNAMKINIGLALMGTSSANSSLPSRDWDA